MVRRPLGSGLLPYAALSRSCDGCTGCRVDFCGDGRRCLIEGEQCDDANRVNGDGCDASCQFEHCGNGIVDPGEECDDGNATPCDGCTGCRVDFCGDGRRCLIEGEQKSVAKGKSVDLGGRRIMKK